MKYLVINNNMLIEFKKPIQFNTTDKIKVKIEWWLYKIYKTNNTWKENLIINK